MSAKLSEFLRGFSRFGVVVWGGIVFGATAEALTAARQDGAPPVGTSHVRFNQPIKGTARSIDMIPVAALPGGAADAPAIWMSKTEIPWEILDICVYGFDKKEGHSDPIAADAVTCPTKPYIATDRGFGHNGWPANSVSFSNAKAFCEWLSAKTGRTYRLPTVEEWQHACQLSKIDAASMDAFAWYDDTSDGTTHKVATKKPDAQGLHDLYGNLAEWCVAADGTGAVLGGSYRDAKDETGCAALEADTPDWNLSDPQIPRSIWWLADAGWIGFRVVCEGAPPADAPVVVPNAPDATGATAEKSPSPTK